MDSFKLEHNSSYKGFCPALLGLMFFISFPDYADTKQTIELGAEQHLALASCLINGVPKIF